MRTFVIRHKETGILLSQAWMTGTSWWEPTPAWEPVNTPRLFRSEWAARTFVSEWVARPRQHKMPIRQIRYSLRENDTPSYYRDPELVEPMPARHKDQLQILEVILTYGPAK